MDALSPISRFLSSADFNTSGLLEGQIRLKNLGGSGFYIGHLWQSPRCPIKTQIPLVSRRESCPSSWPDIKGVGAKVGNGVGAGIRASIGNGVGVGVGTGVIWAKNDVKLWCYGAMGYMTEQVDAHNEVTHR